MQIDSRRKPFHSVQCNDTFIVSLRAFCDFVLVVESHVQYSMFIQHLDFMSSSNLGSFSFKSVTNFEIESIMSPVFTDEIG